MTCIFQVFSKNQLFASVDFLTGIRLNGLNFFLPFFPFPSFLTSYLPSFLPSGLLPGSQRLFSWMQQFSNPHSLYYQERPFPLVDGLGHGGSREEERKHLSQKS